MKKLFVITGVLAIAAMTLMKPVTQQPTDTQITATTVSHVLSTNPPDVSALATPIGMAVHNAVYISTDGVAKVPMKLPMVAQPAEESQSTYKTISRSTTASISAAARFLSRAGLTSLRHLVDMSQMKVPNNCQKTVADTNQRMASRN